MPWRQSANQPIFKFKQDNQSDNGSEKFEEALMNVGRIHSLQVTLCTINLLCMLTVKRVTDFLIFEIPCKSKVCTSKNMSINYEFK